MKVLKLNKATKIKKNQFSQHSKHEENLYIKDTKAAPSQCFSGKAALGPCGDGSFKTRLFSSWRSALGSCYIETGGGQRLKSLQTGWCGDAPSSSSPSLSPPALFLMSTGTRESWLCGVNISYSHAITPTTSSPPAMADGDGPQWRSAREEQV